MALQMQHKNSMDAPTLSKGQIYFNIQAIPFEWGDKKKKIQLRKHAQIEKINNRM